MISVGDLPAINASLNAVSGVLILFGYGAIRKRRVAVHRAFMLAAFVTSTLFLVSYVTYHIQAGSRSFAGPGWLRPIYLTMLISHIILAVGLLPLVIVTIIRAWRGRIEAHRRLARWTFPIWLYVSITGVLIYTTLYRWWPVQDLTGGAI